MTTYEFLTRQRQKNQSCGDTGLYLAGSGSPNDLESHHQSCSFHTFSIPPGSGLASVFETRGSSLQAGIVGLRDKKIKKVTENSNFSPSQSSPFPISLPSQAVTSPRPRETPNAGAIYHSSQMDISSKPHCLPALRTEDLSGIHGSTEARAPVERELIPAGSESSSSALRPNLNGFNPPVNYILPGLQPISKSANEVTSAGLENLRFVSLQHSPSFGSNQGVTSEKGGLLITLI
ncbi:unnamed protein product [Protopolystoma xenopodis]|uniref:Uncharacterized protein n=1 Tax=Protopolystoma xenopodis TaxID=117903 RepID=A0A3S5AJP8_9PLAT|nr:unnamed protein product [Protopolystoma xenopodis]